MHSKDLVFGAMWLVACGSGRHPEMCDEGSEYYIFYHFDDHESIEECEWLPDDCTSCDCLLATHAGEYVHLSFCSGEASCVEGDMLEIECEGTWP